MGAFFGCCVIAVVILAVSDLIIGPCLIRIADALERDKKKPDEKPKEV